MQGAVLNSNSPTFQKLPTDELHTLHYTCTGGGWAGGGGGGAAGGADQGQQGGSPGAAAGSPARANKQSAIAWMGGLLPKYFKSEWSFMQFKLPEGVPSQVAFSSPTELVAACVDGSFHRFTFDATTGQGQATGMERLLSGDEDEQAAAAADGGVAADGMR